MEIPQQDTTFHPIAKPEMFFGTDDPEELLWFNVNSFITIAAQSMPSGKTIIGGIIMMFIFFQVLKCYIKLTHGKKKKRSKSKHYD